MAGISPIHWGDTSHILPTEFSLESTLHFRIYQKIECR